MTLATIHSFNLYELAIMKEAWAWSGKVGRLGRKDKLKEGSAEARVCRPIKFRVGT